MGLLYPMSFPVPTGLLDLLRRRPAELLPGGVKLLSYLTLPSFA